MILRIVVVILLGLSVCGCSLKNNPIGNCLRITRTALNLEEFQVGDNRFVLRFEVPNSFIYKGSSAVFDFCGEKIYEFFFPPRLRLKVANGHCCIFYDESLIAEGKFKTIELKPFLPQATPSLHIWIEGYWGVFCYEIEEFAVNEGVLEIPFTLELKGENIGRSSGRLLINSNWYNFGEIGFPSPNLNKDCARGIIPPPKFSSVMGEEENGG